MLPIPIYALTPEHEFWPKLLDHLNTMKMRGAATENGAPKPDCIYLGVLVEDVVVGHITVRLQALTVPASHLSDEQPILLTRGDGQTLFEAYVQTFAVYPAFRRQGYGRALQEAAMAHAREQGCYQMRSWSSADRTANYMLKLALGFSVVPALYPTPGGAPISGVYFVKRLD
ncbi:MAG: GNAT family N-acetyltransferase [Chloroflexota bacterium]